MNVLKSAASVAVHTGLFITYLYAMTMAGYPILAGAWPVFLMFCGLYAVVFFSQDLQQNAAQQVMLICVTSTVATAILYVGGANARTDREQLIVDGVPNVFGLWSIIGLCCLAVFSAVGFSTLGKLLWAKKQT